MAALGRGPAPKAVPKPTRAAAPALAAEPAPGGDAVQLLLNLIGPTPVPEDVLIRQTGLPASVVLHTLTELEIAQRVDRHAGGAVSRSPAEV